MMDGKIGKEYNIDRSTNEIRDVLQASEPTFDHLNAIADRLQPQQDRLAQAWSRFFAATVNGIQELEILKRAVAEVNQAIAVEIPKIAAATRNAAGSVESFRPRGLDAELKVWFDDHFPADFLRFVAQYRSFSVSFWKSRGWKGFSPVGRASGRPIRAGVSP